MQHLIDEAIAIEDKFFCNWEASSSNRLEEIWEELKKPYAHLYGRHIGDQVGPGWWKDLLAAFEQISEIMKSAPDYKFSVQQIKEKFGGIRLYYIIRRIDDDEEDWPVPEDANRTALWKKTSEVIKRLEKSVSTTCEVCGAPGERRDNGWIMTLCDKHDGMKKAANKKQGL